MDGSNTAFVLHGVQMTGLNNPAPSPGLNTLTFRAIRQRWNMNALRLPLSIPIWRRDGAAYVDTVVQTTRAANREQLLVVLSANDDAANGLPTLDAVEFWKALAFALKDTPGIIFGAFDKPSSRNIPGSSSTVWRPEDWRFWLSGGTLNGGRAAVGMQSLVDAIRSTGATQIISVSAFDDAFDFQGFGPDFSIRDANIIYEAHPYFDHASTDSRRDANLGFVAATFPTYAGEWGFPFGRDTAACRTLPVSLALQRAALFETMAWFDAHKISWTVGDFQAGSLLDNADEFTGTVLDRAGTCEAAETQPGIGSDVLLWMTGDPLGFGSILPEMFANAAGGPARFPSPGEIISVYGQGLGPDVSVAAQLNQSGNIPTAVGGPRFLFDGIPAPIFAAGSFQVNAQVPYEIAAKRETVVQLLYNGVPSNKLTLPVLDFAPEIFCRSGSFSEAAAFNEDGSLNSSGNPAARGTILSLFATGAGLFTPALKTGVPAPTASRTVAPAALQIGAKDAEVLYAGAAPSLVGVVQVNVRVPATIGSDNGIQRASVTLALGSQISRAGITVWIK